MTVALDEAAGTLLVRRSDVAVALNLGADTAVVPVPAGALPPRWCSPPIPACTPAGPGISLPPDTVAVLQL